MVSQATKLTKKEKAHGDSIWAVTTTVLPQGQTVILTGSIDETVVAWNLLEDGSLENRFTFAGHLLGVLSIVASSQSKFRICFNILQYLIECSCCIVFDGLSNSGIRSTDRGDYSHD